MSNHRFDFRSRRIPRSFLLATSMFILLSSIGSAYGSTLLSPSFQPRVTVTTPPVFLQAGTAGSNTIYTNNTSAKVSTTAPAPTPTYYPNSCNVVTGTYASGSVPASVQTVDTNYFNVRSAGTATSTTVQNPSSYALFGSTTLVSGTTTDLASNNGVYMTFRSYSNGTPTAYNPSGYNLVGGTSLASGAASNLASNDGSYMTFRSYPSAFSTSTNTRAFIGYRSNTGTNTLNSPKNRSWNGTAWDATETEMVTAGSPVRLVRVAYSPVAQYFDYKIVAVLSNDGTLDAYVYNGTAWTVSNNLADLWTTAPNRSERPFDIAFSTTSGDALLVYAWYADTSNDLAYRRWFVANQSWGAEVLLDDTTQAPEADYSFVILSTDPTANSNYIGAMSLDSTASHVVAWTWSGAAFGNQTELTGTVTTISREDLGIAFDYTGKLMIVAGEGSNEVIRWNQWTKTGGWGTSQATSDIDPSQSLNPYYITLKADPSTDDLMLTLLDSGNDVHSLYWDGAAWMIYANQDISADTANQRCVDFEWEPTGGKGIQVRGTNNNQITWRTWTTGTGWGADNNPAMGTNSHPWVQLRRNPRNVAGDVKILGAVLEGAVFELGAIKWDGSTFTVIGTSTFTAGTTVNDFEGFEIEFQQFGDPTEFTDEVEFTGKGNTSIWAQLVWAVDSAWDTASVTVTIQLYNWNTTSYPTSGDGYTTYTSSGTPNTDETKTQAITTNPQYYRDASGNWKIKIKGVTSIGTSFQFKADWIEYKPTRAEYTSEVEFTGSSNTWTWTQLVWAVDSAWTVGSVTVTIQVYNYTLGGYPASGNGYDSYTSSSTVNTDQTRTQTITVNPQQFRDVGGNWKIKAKGVKETTTQFDSKADWVEFKPTYNSEYTVSTEFLFSSMTKNTPTQLNFTVVSEYDIASVSVTIQVWNYSSSVYVTSGEGYLTYTSSGTNETRLLSINTNPQFYKSNGNARIKITGVLSTTTQYQQKSNQVKLVYSYSSSSNYNYALKIVNQVSDTWKIRLRAYSQSNIGRLNNCTLYFHNSSDGTSRQIYIQNGAYVDQTGSWYDLPASPAERYVVAALDANNSQVSYVYVYLEILVPNKTTYAQYVITFEIT